MPPSRAVESAPPSIWWWAFGYFAAYAPYAALTKVLTSGLIDTGGTKVTGVELLPATVIAAVVTAAAFLMATGWWRAAIKVRGGRRLPLPTRWTALSGLCASGIIATTTLAYTFKATIVFVMLLMRGGVLVLAPIIDALTARKIRWFSMVALLLSLASLVTSVAGSADPRIPLLCAVDIALYLGFYFVRLQIMSRKAKSSDPDANQRYFVEEQLVSSPALLLVLAVTALAGVGEFGADLRAGFTTFFARPWPVWTLALAVGVLSQGTGIFGGLVLLDRRENTFSIPVNRASSVLAGVVASIFLWLGFATRPPPLSDLGGAAVMVAAILVLSLGGIAERVRGGRPDHGRKLVFAAWGIGAAAASLAVVVATRGHEPVAGGRDRFTLLLSPGHAMPGSAERLAVALSARSGLAVEVRVARHSVDALEAAGTAGVDAGLLPLFEYLLVRQEFGVEARLQALRGDRSHSYRGVLLVREDGGIDGVGDLAGRRVAYVDRASSTGYLLAARHLAEAGVVVSPVFAGDHDAAVSALLAGDVAAAATYEDPTRAGLRVLAHTGAVPNEPVFFHRRVAAATRDKMCAALLALADTPDGVELLRATGGISGFVPVGDADYATVSALLAATQRLLVDVVPDGWLLVDRNRLAPGTMGP